jgi:hypothetical protein
MDSKLSPAQADLHHDGDVLELESKDWTDAEEALAKLAQVASDRRRPKAGSDFSAGPRVIEPSLDSTLRPADVSNRSLRTDPPSPGRRTSRSFGRFLVAACLGVTATLAWQSYGDAARQVIASAAPPIGWLLLSSPSAMNPLSGAEMSVQQPASSTAQVSAPQAASAQAPAVAPTASETAPAGPAAIPPELQEQLHTMAHDLAVMRESVEQLAAGQEQMVRDIAKLQTAGQDIRRRISAPAAAPAAHNPAPLPQPAPQSATGPLPLPQGALPPPQGAPQSSATPLPPLPPEPPRPPMPVR